MISKTFERGALPTGKAICEQQLFNLVDQIEKVKVNEDEIASLMPSVFRKLDWLEKEDIIKRLISMEFNRMIDYYRDADEIEMVDESSRRNETKKEERKERAGRRLSGQAEAGYKRFTLNFGKADGVYPNQLIDLINRCVPGRVQIGRIDLRDTFSYFEVEKGEAQRVMDRMNRYEVDGRVIRVEPVQEKKEGREKGKAARAAHTEKPWRKAYSRKRGR
jgi:ATP-dependent RNA helicase DeaD